MTDVAESTEWLTVIQVANKLGLSKMTVYRMVESKELPAYRFGRAFRIKKEDFEAFLSDKKV